MDKEYIDYIVKNAPPMVINQYAVQVAKTLRPPSIFRPIKRLRFWLSFDRRVQIVISEYAQQLVDEITARQQ